jgi:hypothetical protein
VGVQHIYRCELIGTGIPDLLEVGRVEMVRGDDIVGWKLRGVVSDGGVGFVLKGEGSDFDGCVLHKRIIPITRIPSSAF